MDPRSPPTTSTAFSGGNASASIIPLRAPSTTSGYVEAPAPTMRLRKSSGRASAAKRTDGEADGVDRGESERVDRLRDELAHLAWREEIVARFRPPETGKVDRQHFELPGQPVPHRRERKDAL